MCVPTPATAGSNAPVDGFVIPVPDQVPPGSAAVKITDAAFAQNGPAAVIVALAPLVIVMSKVELVGHAPLVK